MPNVAAASSSENVNKPFRQLLERARSQKTVRIGVGPVYAFLKEFAAKAPATLQDKEIAEVIGEAQAAVKGLEEEQKGLKGPGVKQAERVENFRNLSQAKLDLEAWKTLSKIVEVVGQPAADIPKGELEAAKKDQAALQALLEKVPGKKISHLTEMIEAVKELQQVLKGSADQDDVPVGQLVGRVQADKTSLADAKTKREAQLQAQAAHAGELQKLQGQIKELQTQTKTSQRLDHAAWNLVESFARFLFQMLTYVIDSLANFGRLITLR